MRVSSTTNSSAVMSNAQRAIGEFIGGTFFGPVLKSMQDSPFKTRFSGNSRAQSAFEGQMSLELSKSIGRAGTHGFGKMLYEAVERRMTVDTAMPRQLEQA